MINTNLHGNSVVVPGGQKHSLCGVCGLSAWVQPGVAAAPSRERCALHQLPCWCFEPAVYMWQVLCLRPALQTVL